MRSICQPIYVHVPTCENVGWGLAVICADYINIYLKENQLLFWQKSVANNLDHTHQQRYSSCILPLLCVMCALHTRHFVKYFSWSYIFLNCTVIFLLKVSRVTINMSFICLFCYVIVVVPQCLKNSHIFFPWPLTLCILTLQHSVFTSRFVKLSFLFLLARHQKALI